MTGFYAEFRPELNGGGYLRTEHGDLIYNKYTLTRINIGLFKRIKLFLNSLPFQNYQEIVEFVDSTIEIKKTGTVKEGAKNAINTIPE